MVTPALIWADLDPAASAMSKPARKRLSRAVEQAIAAEDTLGLAAAALGIEPPPAAALTRIADGLEAGNRNWLLAEPVVLLPDRDALALLPLTAAPLDREEEDALAEAARAHFGDALTLERGRSGRWYAAIETVDQATGVPLREAIGRAVEPASLAGGADAARLRAFLNELQMLWYAHPVNEARRADGRPEASSLWLWGGGRLPIKPQAPLPMELRTNAPELVGLALWLGLEREPLAEPEAGAPSPDDLVAIPSGEEVLGGAWLDKFAALRGELRIYAGGNEWRVPARRGLSRLLG
ncbi:MAG: hypothetical protein ACRESR_02420 [Gammaproteobacteria bacterium]